MDKHNGNDPGSLNNQIAQAETPSPIVTITEKPTPIDGYNRENGRTLSENNQEPLDEGHKMTAKERLLQHAVQSHVESQIHAHTQNQTLSPS